MEKKIMKPAEIWIIRRLPILVDPSKPTFSLHCIGVPSSIRAWGNIREGTVMKVLVLALTLRQWSQSPFQKGHQGGCRFPGVSTEHLFSFCAADRTWKEEQSWAWESIYLPSNASTQDMSWRWSCTCETSSSFVRGCGLSKGDIVEINLSLLSCKERIQGCTV